MNLSNWQNSWNLCVSRKPTTSIQYVYMHTVCSFASPISVTVAMAIWVADCRAQNNGQL